MHSRNRSAKEGTGDIGTVDHLVKHLADVVRPGTAIVCVGNELAGDDGAGVAIARRLAERVPWRMFDTASAPESFLMKIVEARPESVVLIDAVDFGGPPGTVKLIETDVIAGQGPSTHGPAPQAFLAALQALHPCRCAVLGIQPAGVEVGSGLSDAVRSAVETIVQAFEALARRQGSRQSLVDGAQDQATGAR